MAASQNGCCSYNHSIHKKTNIMQIMTKNITIFIYFIFYHREIAKLDNFMTLSLSYASTVLWRSRCKTHRFVAAPILTFCYWSVSWVLFSYLLASVHQLHLRQHTHWLCILAIMYFDLYFRIIINFLFLSLFHHCLPLSPFPPWSRKVCTFCTFWPILTHICLQWCFAWWYLPSSTVYVLQANKHSGRCFFGVWNPMNNLQGNFDVMIGFQQHVWLVCCYVKEA